MFLISFLSVAVITCALHAQGRRFEPGRKHIFSFCSVSTTMSWSVNRASSPTLGFHGVMVSTLDFESSDPSSNLGGTLELWTPWRNGSASDSRSEGCVFKSRRGQSVFVPILSMLEWCPQCTSMYVTLPSYVEYCTEAVFNQLVYIRMKVTLE